MISLRNVSKKYGSRPVVQDVTFECPPGTVTGFLGPNGSGKSTTLHMLCGLTRPDSGTATIDGVAYRELPDPAAQVGVLLDASAQHPGRTGIETLHLASLVLGRPSTRVAEVLDQVSLSAEAGRKRVGTYSLGMRQRLGLAQALLGDPAILVLDEPVNGLDPRGIVWIRELLGDFAAHGGTVILASHQLREVEMIADRTVVINEGRIVSQGLTRELLAGPATLVRSPQPERLARALVTAGTPFTSAADGALLVKLEPSQVGMIALDAGIGLSELRPDEDSLERLYLSLTSDPEKVA
jgi:ABC-2 type transport system ATP-binding protein